MIFTVTNIESRMRNVGGFSKPDVREERTITLQHVRGEIPETSSKDWTYLAQPMIVVTYVPEEFEMFALGKSVVVQITPGPV